MFCDLSCGCCEVWVVYVCEGLYVWVVVKDSVNMIGIKDCEGVLGELCLCYMMIVDGYVIEGYVLVVDIVWLLCECFEGV